MKRNIRQDVLKTLLKAQQGELDAVLMYNALANIAENPKDADAFKKLAKDEGHHAAVFYHLTKTKLRPNNTKAVLLPLLYKALGRKRLYPLIAKGEYAAVRTYAPVSRMFPEVYSIRRDEKRHGDILRSLL